MSFTVAAEALFLPEPAGAGRVTVGDDGMIAEVSGPGPADLSVPVLAPGFVDLQCNGIGDVAFGRGGAAMWARARDLLADTGTTTVLPTLVTGCDVDTALEGWTPSGTPDMAGFHLEGPMLSPLRHGAHDPSLMCGLDVEGVLGRPVRLVTLAPEVPDALDAARRLAGAGVAVAAGHTNASAEEAQVAFDAGVRLVTHLWNAMAPLHHRNPGLVGAALADERVRVCVIGDGAHVDPRLVLVTWRAVGTGRFVAVTDSVGIDAAGTAAGLKVVDGAVRAPGGGLCGSAATMDTVLANLVAWGLPIEDALAAVSATPAAAVGLDDRGRLAPGLRADLVALDERLRVLETWCAGSSGS